MQSSMGRELTLPLYQRVKEMQSWYPQDPKYRKYLDDVSAATRTNQTSCKWLWDTMVINWDGSISPCCGVFEKRSDFGAVSKDDKPHIRRLWNSPQYRLARKMVSAYLKKSKRLGFIVKEADDAGIICANCIRYGLFRRLIQEAS